MALPTQQPAAPNPQKAMQNQVRLACDLWRKAFSGDELKQFDRWLAGELRLHKQFGKRDRQFYSETLFLMLRHALFASYAESRASKKVGSLVEFLVACDSAEWVYQLIKKTDGLHILRWTATLVAANDSRNEWSSFILEKDVEFLKELKAELAALPQKTAASALRYSIPYYFVPYLNKRFEALGWSPSQIEKWMAAQTTRPPLWIRFNFAEKSDEAKSELRANAFALTEAGPHACALNGQSSLQKTNAFQNGLIEIQDFASQQIGLAIPIQPKDYFVWDACAGGGGKTMQIASRLANKGAVHASDIREHKLEDIKQRARRAGFFNVRTFVWNGESTPNFSREIEQRGGFDAVLVDAPCSSSGTWRRNPDAKYRFNVLELDALTTLQLSLLTHASKAVRTNGHLVYATCSWLMDENERIVERFLQQHPHFKLTSSKMTGLMEGLDADTMFVAVLQRV